MRREGAGAEATRPSLAPLSPSAVRIVALSLPAVAALLTFSPILNNDFVYSWDDGTNLLNNPSYRGLGWAQLKWMAASTEMGHYQPLSWLLHGLNYTLWGLNPRGYHLTSLILHALNASLVAALSARLYRLARTRVAAGSQVRVWLAAAAAACLFALHPLRAEAVAWATAQRDLLSTFFLLLAVLAYLRARDPVAHRSRTWFGLSVAATAASLLSKPMGVSLPFVLLILDAYPLNRIGAGVEGGWSGPQTRRAVVEKTPFFLLAIAAALIALVAESQVGAMVPIASHGIPERMALALFGAAFYLWTTLFPLSLSPLYQRPQTISLLEAELLLSGLALITITAGLIWRRRRWPGLLTAWLAYLAMLAPVSGIVQLGPFKAADRYTYVSCIGWAILAGGGLMLWGERLRRIRAHAVAPILVAVALSLLFGVLAWRQSQVWRNAETLWRHAIAYSSECSVGHNNLGIELGKQRRYHEAIEHYTRANEITPAYRNAISNMAGALAMVDRLPEAEALYRRLLHLSPRNAIAHNNLANVLSMQDKTEGVVALYERALELDPAYDTPALNLGKHWVDQGRYERALQAFDRAYRIRPEQDSSYWKTVIRSLRALGRDDEADKVEARILELRTQ